MILQNGVKVVRFLNDSVVRNALIKARGERTQTEVAGELGINQQTLSRLELGVRNPSSKLMAKISAYYGMPADAKASLIMFSSFLATINFLSNSCVW